MSIIIILCNIYSYCSLICRCRNNIVSCKCLSWWKKTSLVTSRFPKACMMGWRHWMMGWRHGMMGRHGMTTSSTPKMTRIVATIILGWCQLQAHCQRYSSFDLSNSQWIIIKKMYMYFNKSFRKKAGNWRKLPNVVAMAYQIHQTLMNNMIDKIQKEERERGGRKRERWCVADPLVSCLLFIHAVITWYSWNILPLIVYIFAFIIFCFIYEKKLQPEKHIPSWSLNSLIFFLQSHYFSFFYEIQKWWKKIAECKFFAYILHVYNNKGVGTHIGRSCWSQ